MLNGVFRPKEYREVTDLIAFVNPSPEAIMWLRNPQSGLYAESADGRHPDPAAYESHYFYTQKRLGGSALVIPDHRIGVIDVPLQGGRLRNAASVTLSLYNKHQEWIALRASEEVSYDSDREAFCAEIAARALYNVANGIGGDAEVAARIAGVYDDLEFSRLDVLKRLHAQRLDI